MTLNDAVQLLSVVIVLVICAIWIVGRIRSKRGGSSCGCCDTKSSASDGCSSCPLIDNCHKKR